MTLRHAALTTLVAFGVLVASAGGAVAQALVDVSPAVVQPGATVTLIGVRGFASGPAIEVRLDDPSGPVLATSTSAQSGFGPIAVTIPADTKAGLHVLLVSQALRRTDAGVRGLPARVAIQVTGPGGLPVRGDDVGGLRVEQGRPTDLVVEEKPGPSTGALVLAGLGAAAVLLIAAVPAALLVGRRGRAVPAPVSEDRA